MSECTCDAFGESPCPVHARENALQDRAIEAENRVRRLEQLNAALNEEVVRLRMLPSGPLRRQLPSERPSITHKFDVAGQRGYLTVGLYPGTNEIGEIFVRMSKEGSTISGLLDSFAKAVSVALQYGAPIEDLVRKFSHTRFEPAGFSAHPEIGFAKSIVDYIFRWIGWRFDVKQEGEANEQLPLVPRPETPLPSVVVACTGPPCVECGTLTQPAGKCHVCPSCGSTTGCS